jgi:hypothetical protein
MSLDRQQPVFPFFIGCGRSGTTLVRAMFDAHPELAVVAASFFAPGFARRREQYERPEEFDIERFLTHLTTHFGFPRLGLPAGAVAEAVRETAPKDTVGAVRTVFGYYARSHGKTLYGDKTALFVLNVPVLASFFPESKFVHIIRDGRDVALAYLARADMGPESIDEAALYWRRHVLAGRRAGKALGGGRYMELRYEALIDDPEGNVRTVCDFLGIAFDPMMLRYYEQAPAALPGTAHPEYHQSNTRPPTKGLRDWRKQMDGDDVATFEALAGGLLSDLGYERAVTSPSPAVRARAGMRRVQIEGMRNLARARRRVRQALPGG